MLPAGAPSVDIDVSANSVTLTGTFVWDFVVDSSGNRDPNQVFAARSQTPYALQIPYRGSPFHPDFAPPTDHSPEGFALRDGTAAASIGDIKKGAENDAGSGLQWGFYEGDLGYDVSPQGVILNTYVVSDAGLGRLDASQFYTPIIAFDADFSHVTAVAAQKFDEYPIFGTDIFTTETWVGFDTVPGGAAVADYRAENGLDTGPGGGGGDDDLIDRSDAKDPVTESGGVGDDTILGGRADDTLSGGAGADSLNGGRGRDDISGGGGKDRAKGGAGRDEIDGNAGKDRIAGGGGNDTLNGGAGNDRVTGNRGVDTFEFTGAFGNDVITDFVPLTDILRIVGEVANGRQFRRALTEDDGDLLYDFEGDGINVIRFKDTDIAGMAGTTLEFA